MIGTNSSGHEDLEMTTAEEVISQDDDQTMLNDESSPVLDTPLTKTKKKQVKSNAKSSSKKSGSQKKSALSATKPLSTLSSSPTKKAQDKKNSSGNLLTFFQKAQKNDVVQTSSPVKGVEPNPMVLDDDTVTDVSVSAIVQTPMDKDDDVIMMTDIQEIATTDEPINESSLAGPSSLESPAKPQAMSENATRHPAFTTPVSALKSSFEPPSSAAVLFSSPDTYSANPLAIPNPSSPSPESRTSTPTTSAPFTGKPKRTKRTSSAAVGESSRSSAKKSKKNNNVFRLEINQIPFDLQKHPRAILALSEFFSHSNKLSLLEDTSSLITSLDSLICLYGHEYRGSLQEIVSTLVNALYPFATSAEDKQEKEKARSLLLHRVPLVLTRTNYGLDIETVKQHLPFPVDDTSDTTWWETAPWCVWIWEANRVDFLPESDPASATIVARKAERTQMSFKWRDGFLNMEDSQKKLLFASVRKPTVDIHADLESSVPSSPSTPSTPSATTTVLPNPNALFNNELKKQKELEKKQQKERVEELKKQKQRERDLAREQKAQEKQRLKDEKEKEKLARKQQKEESEKAVQEAKVKQLKAQASLMNMFVAQAPGSSNSGIVSSTVKTSPVKTDYQKLFRPFHVKEHMALAPLPSIGNMKDVPLSVDDSQILQSNFQSFCKHGRKHVYAKPLIPRNYRVGGSSVVVSKKGGSDSNNDQMVIVLDDDEMASEFGKRTWKLLQFAENIRPAYFGTWLNKSSKIVSGRKPFAQDTTHFDYEYDSEAEWEEDEPGEELKSDDEDEEDDEAPGGREEEEEDGWLVPHGYLSDDEGIEEDAEDSPVDLKRKLKQPKEKKVATENAQPGKRKPLEPLIPIVLGPLYHNFSLQGNEALANMCAGLVCVFGEGQNEISFSVDPYKTPVVAISTETHQIALSAVATTPKTTTPALSTKSTFPQDLLPNLVTFLTDRDEKLSTLVDMFQKQYPYLKKVAIENQIRIIAERTKCHVSKKFKWTLKTNLTSDDGSNTPTGSASNETMISATTTPNKTVQSKILQKQ